MPDVRARVLGVARRSWWQLSRVLRRSPAVVEGLSVNDDFTDNLTDVVDLIERRWPAFIGVQEGKRHVYESLLRRFFGLEPRYQVRQDLTGEGPSGVAVLWDTLRCRAIGTALNDPDELGGGWLELTPAGHGLTARGVVWQDLRVRIGWLRRRTVRVCSAHRPPQRNRDQWPLFDARLAAFCKDSPHAVVVFMDCNEAGGPDALVELTGLRWYGQHFDGALTDLHVPGGVAEALDRADSDHKPVSIPVEI